MSICGMPLVNSPHGPTSVMELLGTIPIVVLIFVVVTMIVYKILIR